MNEVQGGDLAAIHALRASLNGYPLLGFARRDRRDEAPQAKAAFVGTTVADLSVTNTPSTTSPTVGSNVTFTVALTNNSPNTGVGFQQVVDTVPAGTTFVSSTVSTGTYNQATGAWNIQSLNAQSTAQLQLTVRVNNTNAVTNTATITPQANNVDNNPANNTASSTVTPTPPAPCYVTSTRMRVLRGRTVADVPVERLRMGDLAITACGKPRPIRWIGSRSYPGYTAPRHDRPVRIRAGALAEGVPARDLLVSPDHCLMVDGLFIAAGHLHNGTSIVRGEAVADLTYWHVELDTHDLLLAENTPAESFLAAPGVRAGFDGVGEADDAGASPLPYAARIERADPRLDALRARLTLRAGLSVEPTRYGAVRAWLDVCDGARVAGWAVDEAHPGAPVCLDILVDKQLVAMAFTQDERHDLAAAGLGDGRCGFDIMLDAPLAPGVAHTVEVRRSADGLLVAAKAVDAAGVWTALLAA